MVEDRELEKAGIDVKKGMLYTQGDKVIYEGFLKTFYEDRTYDKLLECIDKKDAENAYLHTCSLCGSSSYLGMSGLYDALYCLMGEMREGTFEKSDAMMKEVEEKYNRVMQTLKKSFAKA